MQLKTKFLITILSSVWTGMLIILVFQHFSTLYIFFPLFALLIAILILVVIDKVKRDNNAYKKLKKRRFT